MTDDRDIRLLKQKLQLLGQRLGRAREFLRGSVVLMKRRCTYPRCRKCASGIRHPTWVLTLSRKGKTQTFYVGKKHLADAKRLVENYRRLAGIVEEMAQINLVLFRYNVSLKKGAGDGRRGQGP